MWGAQPSNPVQDFLPVERRGGSTISTTQLPTTSDAEAPLRELAYARERARMMTRRLHLLQVQQAKQGITTDPAVVIEMEDLSRDLEQLRAEIVRLEKEGDMYA
jgi:hypothetical protein